MTDITVLLVDDHPVVRAGLRALLDAQEGLRVIGEAADGEEAVTLARDLAPDVVLMDLQMPRLGGAAATARIAALDDPPYVLILTVYDTDADIFPAVEAGAVGYLLKDTPPQDLARAVSAAADGQTVLAPAVAARLMQRSRTPARDEITAREIEILTLLAQGLSNRDIARRLHITEATVKTHLVHIFGKLAVDNRTAAVAAARRRGVLRDR